VPVPVPVPVPAAEVGRRLV